MFGEACLIKQFYDVSNFINTLEQSNFFNTLKTKNAKIQAEQNILENKWRNEWATIQSKTLDNDFLIKIKPDSKEFFWVYLQNFFYKRLLGFKIYDILKDENVKTVPKDIQDNILKQYTANKNELDKLTIYFKTTKKCIEYGLLLPFSAKYRL